MSTSEERIAIFCGMLSILDFTRYGIEHNPAGALETWNQLNIEEYDLAMGMMRERRELRERQERKIREMLGR